MYNSSSIFAGLFFVLIIFGMIAIAIGIAAYIFQSIALYTIAKRRQLKSPWMAWVPVVSAYLLGSVADQYEYMVNRRVKKYRVILLALNISSTALSLIASVLVVALEASAIRAGYDYNALNATATIGIVTIICTIAMYAIAITYLVFHFIALHRLYKSCKPESSTLFTVFSILFGITIPIFMFICRKSDKGFYVPAQQTVYQNTTYSAQQ